VKKAFEKPQLAAHGYKTLEELKMNQLICFTIGLSLLQPVT